MVSRVETLRREIKFPASGRAIFTTALVMATLEELVQEDWKSVELDPEILRMSTDDIVARTRLLGNEIKVGQ